MRPSDRWWLVCVALILILGACGGGDRPQRTATEHLAVDTMPGGWIAVANSARGLWDMAEAWQVVEDVRIGSVEGDGAEVFGRIRAVELDAAGRMYVFEELAQELRVFGPDGRHLRTIGRKGGGPGEFAFVTHIQFGPDDRLWVIDPENNRVSWIDSTGAFLGSEWVMGGMVLLPWPGGLDQDGYYYVPAFTQGGRMGLARFTPDLVSSDTLNTPRGPSVPDHAFEIRTDERLTRVPVPFTQPFRWRLAPTGTFWALFHHEYRLVELSLDGDTLRTATRDYQPVTVTEEDITTALEDLQFFVDRGGQIDLSRIPSEKPATRDLFFDDDGNVWVIPWTSPAEQNRVVDVFDGEGRYLGRVSLPFRLPERIYPVFKEGTMLAVAVDDDNVPYVVRARIDGR
ncbi:MAG: 6-bladed beta-propeller [Planctomycetota bacterium]|jgi:sugar lactone lactonase YvrE